MPNDSAERDIAEIESNVSENSGNVSGNDNGSAFLDEDESRSRKLINLSEK
jgi:hypothetical protein